MRRRCRNNTVYDFSYPTYMCKVLYFVATNVLYIFGISLECEKHIIIKQKSAELGILID